MSDTYEWEQPCPKCKAKLEVGYNATSGPAFTEVTCNKCHTTFDVIMTFKLKEMK